MDATAANLLNKNVAVESRGHRQLQQPPMLARSLNALATVEVWRLHLPAGRSGKSLQITAKPRQKGVASRHFSE
jgi:hypothetical protein